MSNRTAALAVAAASALALAPAASASCHPGHHDHHEHHRHHEAHTVRYVNLGDSFAAGTGLEPLASKAPAACRQASNNLAHDLATKLHYSLTDVSCSGATTSDFFSPQYAGVTQAQLNAIDKHTDVVTIMIGGNDSNVFSTALNTCSQLGFSTNGTGSPCTDKLGSSLTDTVTSTTYPALVRALDNVRAKAPHAKIAVIAYPRLLPKSGTCFPSMPIATGDVAFVNTLQATLNDAIKRAAKRTHVTYVDAYSAASGHDACQPVGTRWVEPVIGGVTKQPAHPNALGEKALADLTRKALHLS